MRSAPALQAKRHPLLLQNFGSPFTQRSQKPSLRNGHPENLKAEICLRAYLCFWYVSVPHQAMKRSTISTFAARLTIRTFSFTRGKTHALTAIKKTNQVIYRCRQPSERGIYDTRKDKKRHRIRRQRSSARSGLTALWTRRRRYVATGGINDSCLYTAHSTKKSSQIIALHAGKKI